MKKILMLLLLLLGIAGAVGGYYIFYLKPQQDALQAEQPEPIAMPETVPAASTPKSAEEKVTTDYYVNPERLGVREHPDYEAFIESILYRGDKIHVLEQKEGWGRISPYYVYGEGQPEVAEWVPMEALLEVPPTVTRQERLETISHYIEKSDDFKRFFDVFVEQSDLLLKQEICKPEDFEETGGWVRSVRYKDRDVYFVYCGGLKQSNKVYLDVRSGEVFYK
ncbi:hypothetical protein [Vibrio sp.]|uniref:hypothetical protein n=1 Tax=Vibrio sp. TaxID=678 RepID=UPI003D0BBA5D